MKHLLPILLLLCAAQTFAQVPLDSAYWDIEMEDSLSSFSIKPFEHPKELLMQALVRLEKDLQYKHSKREYSVEAIFKPWIRRTLTIGYTTPAKSEDHKLQMLTCRRTFTVEGDNGLNITNYKLVVDGPLSVELPYYVPITLRDSSLIEFKISTSYGIDMHVEVDGSQYKYVEIPDIFTYYTLEKIYKSILRVYKVTAYYIGNDSGRGVYRIHLEEKKNQRTREYYQNQEMKWYLDCQSLRLTQINSKKLNNGYLTIQRYDIGEENEAPIVTKATTIIYRKDDSFTRTAIQLIEK